MNSASNLSRYFLLIVLVAFASVGRGQSKKAPEWVWSTPVDSDTYYGVGIAKLEEENYRLQARKMALREITEKIFVTIDSRSALAVKYSQEEIEYRLNEQIDVASSSMLLGHEKMDDWIDPKTDSYYVLFKLDRALYEKERDLHFEEVINNINLIQEDANFLMKSGDLTSAVIKTGESLNQVFFELRQLIEPKYQNLLNKKKVELVISLENQLRRVKFKNLENFEFDVKDKEPLVISQFAYDNQTSEVLHDLPMALTNHQGEVFWYEFANHLDGDQLKIYGLIPHKFSAKIQLEVKFPLSDKIMDEIDPSIREGLKSNVISISFIPYAIVVNSRVSGDYTQKTHLVNYLTYIFQDIGLHQPSKDEAPHYAMNIMSNYKIIREDQMYYDMQLSGDVTISDSTLGKKLYGYQFVSGVGVGATPEHASSRAMRELVDKNASLFIEDYLKFLCSKH